MGPEANPCNLMNSAELLASANTNTNLLAVGMLDFG